MVLQAKEKADEEVVFDVLQHDLQYDVDYCVLDAADFGVRNIGSESILLVLGMTLKHT